ncbi:MAG: ABC transporter substrate-binding protein [Candidatus Acidiferrum sp.]|jgi:peptide/nickel transport system substrate-binding protein
MRFIASPWFAAGRIFSAALAVALACAAAFAAPATLPRYGGTLVVEVHTSSLILDPAKWKSGAPDSAASEQIATAVFDRLLTLDRFGRFQPALATEWSHDAAARRWQFTLRSGVQFSDGSPLTAADAAAALQELFAALALAQPTVTVSGPHLIVQFSSPVSDLLGQLASPRYFIFRRAADGLLGTGPFFVKEFIPATGGTTISRYKLAANEHCWAGRPFVDALDVYLGVPPLRQLIDLQLGKADVVEISPDLVRRAAQENLRVWASSPVLLYALQLNAEAIGPDKVGIEKDGAVKANPAHPADASKSTLGEALSLSLDRATMANVLLQRQAEPARSFLPEWLSGYAFVFSMETNVERAKEISATLSAASSAPSAPGSSPLRLRVDAAGDVAKLLAERVAINARQAGIPVQVQPRSVAHETSSSESAGAARNTGSAGFRLIAWRYSSLSQRAELDSMIATLQLESAPEEKDKTAADPEQLYLRERQVIAARELIPLVMLPEYIGLGAGVRDWMAERWGEWHLGDVWLDGKRAPGSPAPVSAASPAAAHP